MTAQLKDLTRQKQAGKATTGLVKISYGVHSLEAAISGKAVGEVRQALKEPLNIDPRALALVNGRDVAAAYILKEGDQLEFVRLAGEKGWKKAALLAPHRFMRYNKQVKQIVQSILEK